MWSTQLLTSALLLSRIVSTETVQSYWTVPNGALGGDFKQTFIDGETLPISWEGWGSVWTEDFLDNITVADLWLTSYNYEQYQYSEFLTDKIDISKTGSYTWTIDIASTSLANTAEYVLRFLPPQVKYNTTSVQISSPGFIVLQKSATTTTAETATMPTSSIANITSIPPPTATTTITSIHSSSSSETPASAGLGTGAKAGIGVGAAIGAVVVIIAILGGFVYRHRLRRKTISASGQFESPADYYMVTGNRMKHSYSPKSVHELPTPPVELDAGGRS